MRGDKVSSESLTASKAGRRRRSPVASADRTPIESIMVGQAVTVPSRLGVDSLRELLLSKGLSRVPVVDEDGRAIGIVSLTDLVKESHERQDEPNGVLDASTQRGLPRGMHLAAADKTVADVMSKVVLTLPPSASIAQAAELMVAHHLHGLPVCSKEGIVVGFLSSSDVLAWLAGLR